MDKIIGIQKSSGKAGKYKFRPEKNVLERKELGEMGLSGTFFVKFKYCALVQEGNCVKVEKFSENKYERYM